MNFSEFIRNASDEEKQRVYAAVLDGATLRQRMKDHGCKKASIHNMDHNRSYDAGNPDIRVNRICTTCYQHWAGPVGAVKEYTRKQWDEYVDESWRNGL